MKRKRGCAVTLLILTLLLIVALVVGYYFYNQVFTTNSRSDNQKITILIPSGSNYNDVLRQLVDSQIVSDEFIFDKVARRMNYPNHVHPGRYTVNSGISMYHLIRKLRSAESEPVRVALDRVSDIYEWAAKAGNALEIDSAQITDTLISKYFLKENGVNENNVLSLFIPDTYEFYWEISLKAFINRMQKEYQKFWTTERKEKANELGLSLNEVYILASIVQEEAVIVDEMPRIAGVYINRLKKNMALQADPTIKYIVRKRTDKKVYLADYKIVSLYNTYVNTGLPPGPIAITSSKAIDAVINFEKHQYIYFCARADGSGYHEFTADYNQHIRNRNLYIKAKN